MSYEYQPTDWAKFEASREAILGDQDIVQATIDESMRKGDLFEAGVACLDHVITSYELGDQKEGAMYLALGVALSTAGTFAVPEHLRHKSAEEKTFEMPKRILASPYELVYRDDNGDAACRKLGVDDAIKEIEINLTSTEALINNEFCSATNKNQAIHDTVKSIGDFYFDFMMPFIPPSKHDDQIIKLVKELAENIEIDENPANHKLAFYTFWKLSLLATSMPGKTNSALNLASRGFKELIASSNDEMIRGISQTELKNIRLAQIARLASAPTAVLKNAKTQTLDYGLSNDPEWHRIQSSKKAREAAKAEYHRIGIEHKLQEMRTAHKKRLNHST